MGVRSAEQSVGITKSLAKKSKPTYELAHKGVKDFETRPQYEHKSGASASRYANIGGYGLWECAARNNPLVSQNP